jgi:hypothetical protein
VLSLPEQVPRDERPTPGLAPDPDHEPTDVDDREVPLDDPSLPDAPVDDDELDRASTAGELDEPD